MNQIYINKIKRYSISYKIIAILSFLIGLLFIFNIIYSAITDNRTGIINYSYSIESLGVGLSLIITALFAYSLGFWCEIKSYEFEN